MGGFSSEEKRDNGAGAGQNVVDEGKDVNTMNRGAKMDGCTQDLVGSGWKQDAVEAAERESRAEVGDHCRTTEELADSNRPHSSDELTAGSIRNPSVLPILTASEWDPGPRKSDGETVAARGN